MVNLKTNARKPLRDLFFATRLPCMYLKIYIGRAIQLKKFLGKK